MNKILIVDDEKSVRFLYEKIFKKEVARGDFELLFAMSCETALEQLDLDKKCGDIQLIISDINMPGLSGFELLKEVIKKCPKLPVFMSSAYTDTERQSLAKELGATDYITKPINFKDLKEKIIKILKN